MEFETYLNAALKTSEEYGIAFWDSFLNLTEPPLFRKIMRRRNRQRAAFRARLVKMYKESEARGFVDGTHEAGNILERIRK